MSMAPLEYHGNFSVILLNFIRISGLPGIATVGSARPFFSLTALKSVRVTVLAPVVTEARRNSGVPPLGCCCSDDPPAEVSSYRL